MSQLWASAPERADHALYGVRSNEQSREHLFVLDHQALDENDPE